MTNFKAGFLKTIRNCLNDMKKKKLLQLYRDKIVMKNSAIYRFTGYKCANIKELLSFILI